MGVWRKGGGQWSVLPTCRFRLFYYCATSPTLAARATPWDVACDIGVGDAAPAARRVLTTTTTLLVHFTWNDGNAPHAH